MSTSAAEIETIIRVVMERLRLVEAAPVNNEGPKVHHVSADHDAATLRLNSSLVTLEHLHGQLHGIRVVKVPKRAVITPAVFDELRRLKVSLQRLETDLNDATTTHAAGSVMMIAPSAKMSKQLSSQWLSVPFIESPELETTIQAIVRHVAEPNAEAQRNGVIWCSARPFAAALATRTQPQLRAAQLSNLNDLSPAIAQVQPNVLIIDPRLWPVTMINNLLRTWRV